MTLFSGNPGLVIAGSGRSADVLAEAYRLSTPEEAIDKNGYTNYLIYFSNFCRLGEKIKYSNV